MKGESPTLRSRRFVEITDIKRGLLSRHFFKRTQQHGGPNVWVTINLFKKLCLPVITWNKKIFIEENGINDIIMFLLDRVKKFV